MKNNNRGITNNAFFTREPKVSVKKTFGWKQGTDKQLFELVEVKDGKVVMRLKEQ